MNDHPTRIKRSFMVNGSNEHVRDDHDLEDCTSVSGTASHEPDSSVPEAMDVMT